MVYMVKRGTFIPTIFSALSPEALILTWLLYGLLPLTLTAGLGSKESLAIGSIPIPTSNPNRQISNINDTADSNNSNDVPHYFYYCPTPCQCEYSTSSQQLEISCSSSSVENSGSMGDRSGTTTTPTAPRLDLSAGVRILRISHALLDTKSMEVVPTLVKNTLVELDLQHVSINPKSFFTGTLFQNQGESLRKITIKSGTLVGVDSDTAAATFFRGTLQPFESLRSMDSLNICDSSPSLAAIVLQAMPTVVHLRAVNNSLYEIPYESLSPSSHQYSIESIDFSKNHLALIPNGLLEGLTKLRTLDVSHNRIFHLQEQVFTGLKSLRKLNVSHNQIEYVDAEVFTPLRSIKIVDISYNDVVQFFEPYFSNNKELEVLNMSNMWVTNTFTSADTALRSLIETERLITSLQRVESLDISKNGMRSIPETLTHAPRLQKVYMDGNMWECLCQDRWFLDWVATTSVSIGDKNSTDNMWCFQRNSDGETVKRPFHQYLTGLTMTCTNNNIIARTPFKFHTLMGKNKKLSCHAQNSQWPKITWITPSKQYISAKSVNNDSLPTGFSYSRTSQEEELQHRLSPDGSLNLSNVTGVDYGLYLCIASYEDLNITHYVHLGMDVSVFRDVKLMSILVGWLFSFSFLALVLLFQLVMFILNKLGVRCACMGENANQTKHVRAFFDTMEQHKTSQLDWLRDNYNMQAKKIKENCYSQLDRIRESYTNQSKNLGGIRDYGTQQLHTVRDQYNDQVRRVASYSAHQLCKVRENYVFKRNQVCKFSNHQMLRLRETYKWQAQTLNKILENLPRGLNFDTCRGMGACGRTDSIYLDDMGEDFIGAHDVDVDVVAKVYGLSHGSMTSGLDKMEHVSLLIPPEFVCDYRRTSTAEAGYSGGKQRVVPLTKEQNTTEPEEEECETTQTVEDTTEVEDEDTTVCLPPPEDSSSGNSTPLTATLHTDSTTSTSRRQSDESILNDNPDILPTPYSEIPTVTALTESLLEKV